MVRSVSGMVGRRNGRMEVGRWRAKGCVCLCMGRDCGRVGK